MVFQAGRWWAERDDNDEEAESLKGGGEESRSDSRSGEISEAVTPEMSSPEIPQKEVPTTVLHATETFKSTDWTMNLKKR